MARPSLHEHAILRYAVAMEYRTIESCGWGVSLKTHEVTATGEVDEIFAQRRPDIVVAGGADQVVEQVTRVAGLGLPPVLLVVLDHQVLEGLLDVLDALGQGDAFEDGLELVGRGRQHLDLV